MWAREIREQAAEIRAEAARQRAEAAVQRAEAAHQRAAAAEQRAEAARERAEAARQRAQAHQERKHSSDHARFSFGGISFDSSCTFGEGSSVTSHNENGDIVDIRNGWKTTYAGKNMSLLNGRLFIDGSEVIENDPRITKREKASLNFGNGIRMTDKGIFFGSAAKAVDEEKLQLEKAPAASKHEDSDTSIFRLR